MDGLWWEILLKWVYDGKSYESMDDNWGYPYDSGKPFFPTKSQSPSKVRYVECSKFHDESQSVVLVVACCSMMGRMFEVHKATNKPYNSGHLAMGQNFGEAHNIPN